MEKEITQEEVKRAIDDGLEYVQKTYPEQPIDKQFLEDAGKEYERQYRETEKVVNFLMGQIIRSHPNVNPRKTREILWEKITNMRYS